MLSGDNSILNQAGRARDITGENSITERVQLAYTAAITVGNGELTEHNLRTELTNEFGDDYSLNEDPETNEWIILVSEVERLRVNKGKITPQGPKENELPIGEGTVPYLPSSAFHQLPGTSLENGLVITDAVDLNDTSNPGNEYVWIEVPNSNLEGETPTYGPDYISQGITTAKITEEIITDEQKTRIETALINYVTTDLLNGSDYNTSRMGWKDEWYDSNGKRSTSGGTPTDVGGCGLTETAYNTLYKKMLKSVYNNGGFWIGRYEAGTTTARNSGDSTAGITPLSKIDLYPINWVTCSEAQIIAESVTNKGSYSSSLMFGIQWDCILKYLNKKGNMPVVDLTSNSDSWGNYNLDYDLNQSKAHGFKGTVVYYTSQNTIWTAIESGYSHQKSDSEAYLLSTGATTRNMKQNIYDLGGNVHEYTLERSYETNFVGDIKPCVSRGDSFLRSYPASSRESSESGTCSSGSGLRVCIY